MSSLEAARGSDRALGIALAAYDALTEEAAEAGVRFLLDGLGVASIGEAKRLVDLGLYYRHMRSNGMMLVEMPFVDSDDRTDSTDAERDAGTFVLGRCVHGVDLDRDLCPRGCRG